MYVLTLNNIVLEMAQQTFPVVSDEDNTFNWVELLESHGEVLEGMYYSVSDNVFSEVVPTLPQLIEELAEIRYEKEVGGLTVNGVRYQTDRESKSNATALILESLVNGMVMVNWKKDDGSFQVLETQNFKQVAKSVFKYVNDCFGREMQLQNALINAEEPSTVDLYSDWPSDIVNVTFV